MEKLLEPPDENGYSVTESQTAAEYQALPGGRSRMRLDEFGSSRTVTLVWSGSKKRYLTVRKFINDNLGLNCPDFLMDLIVAQSVYKEYVCNIVKDSVSMSTGSSLSWTIQATFEVEPRDDEETNPIYSKDILLLLHLNDNLNEEIKNRQFNFTGSNSIVFAPAKFLDGFSWTPTNGAVRYAGPAVIENSGRDGWSLDFQFKGSPQTNESGLNGRYTWLQIDNSFQLAFNSSGIAVISNVDINNPTPISDNQISAAFHNIVLSALPLTGGEIPGKQTIEIYYDYNLIATVQQDICNFFAISFGDISTAAGYGSSGQIDEFSIWSHARVPSVDYSYYTNIDTVPGTGDTPENAGRDLVTNWNTLQLASGDRYQTFMAFDHIDYENLLVFLHQTIHDTFGAFPDEDGGLISRRYFAVPAPSQNGEVGSRKGASYAISTLMPQPEHPPYGFSDASNRLSGNYGVKGNYRRDLINNNATVSLNWILSAEEYSNIQQAYQLFVKFGGVDFTMNLFVQDVFLEQVQCQFIFGSFKTTQVQGETYYVTAQISLVPNPYDVVLNPFEVDSGLTNMRLAAEKGSYILTGYDFQVIMPRKHVTAVRGLYTLTGQKVIGLPTYFTVAEGSYTLTGKDANLRFGVAAKLLAAKGSYTLTGQDSDGSVSDPIISVNAEFDFANAAVGSGGAINSSNGNRTATINFGGGTGFGGVPVLRPRKAGKYYWEFVINATGNTVFLGWMRKAATPTISIAASPNSSAGFFALNGGNGSLNYSGGSGSVGGGTGTYGFAVDISTGEIWISVNGVFGGSQNPAAGTGAIAITSTGDLDPGAPACTLGDGFGAAQVTFNGATSNLAYTPPAGFAVWADPDSTANDA